MAYYIGLTLCVVMVAACETGLVRALLRWAAPCCKPRRWRRALLWMVGWFAFEVDLKWRSFVCGIRVFSNEQNSMRSYWYRIYGGIAPLRVKKRERAITPGETAWLQGYPPPQLYTGPAARTLDEPLDEQECSVSPWNKKQR